MNAIEYFMVPEDTYSLQRMLGSEDIPLDVKVEYQIRIKMFHRDGNQGPMRTLALIDMVRSLGYGVTTSAQACGPTDWRQYAVGTPVEALRAGEWTPGTYNGFVSQGTIAVRFESGGGAVTVGEFVRAHVRPVKSSVPTDIHAESVVDRYAEDDKPDARAGLLPNAKQVAERAAQDALDKAAAEEHFRANDLDELDEGFDEDSDEGRIFNWSSLEKGSPVHVQIEGQISAAKFVRYDPDHQAVVVIVAGEKKHSTFDRELVWPEATPLAAAGLPVDYSPDGVTDTVSVE